MFAALTFAALLLGADPLPFDQAAVEENAPKDKMFNGKSIAEVRTKVKELWPTIVFAKDGKKLDYKVKFETDDGDIEVSFYPEQAPNHARSMICLAKAGYYDGLIFHRCMQDFMIQGGCPYGTGEGGPGYRLKREFSELPHGPGILSAARSRSPDSAGSQFFLCLTRQRTAHLDKQYSVFGKVTAGMDVVNKIVARPSSDPDGEKPDKPCNIKKAVVLVD